MVPFVHDIVFHANIIPQNAAKACFNAPFSMLRCQSLPGGGFGCSISPYIKSGFAAAFAPRIRERPLVCALSSRLYSRMKSFLPSTSLDTVLAAARKNNREQRVKKWIQFKLPLTKAPGQSSCLAQTCVAIARALYSPKFHQHSGFCFACQHNGTYILNVHPAITNKKNQATSLLKRAAS